MSNIWLHILLSTESLLVMHIIVTIKSDYNIFSLLFCAFLAEQHHQEEPHYIPSLQSETLAQVKHFAEHRSRLEAERLIQSLNLR